MISVWIINWENYLNRRQRKQSTVKSDWFPHYPQNLMNFPDNNGADEPTIVPEASTVPLPPVVERITNIRQSINELAQDPAVLELVCSGTYHPDLRMGDAIEALDELAFALSEFAQAGIAPLYRLDTKPGVLIALKFHDTRKP
jgi:hypothetical protein